MTCLIAHRHTANPSLRTPKAEYGKRGKGPGENEIGKGRDRRMEIKGIRARVTNWDRWCPKVVRRVCLGSKKEKQSRGTARKFE